MILALAIAGSVAHTYVRSLACGTSTFHMESLAVRDREAPLAPQQQSLLLESGGRRLLVKLDRLGTVKVGKYRVQRSFVSSWACVTAKTNMQYVYLEYACAIDPGEPGSCDGDEEWFHWIDLNGRVLDRGVPRSGGPALERLDRRLGLDEVSRKGIQMQNAIDDL